MHLKSIEMVGFKSFADKTVIELKGGISSVVGPNGCGKSNIVDALRWSLGEMSARSLRSRHMSDVIFSGSAGRQPVNLSEVTLTFDNTDHTLPIDYSEVQVTRRLYRSGESEYYLNKTQCRLKDIRDMFLDTGIGEGYSILAQGEVDFVMNAKAEERRELFEEAAGISKYKARREECLSKLERVELDLSRLNDIIALIKEQMDSLESAAKKATLFQKLKDELKSLEITDSVHQWTRFEEQYQTSQKRMDELKTDHQKCVVDLDCGETELTQNRIALDDFDRKIHELQTALTETEKELFAADLSVKSAIDREREYTERLKNAQERLQHTSAQIAQLEQKISQGQDGFPSLEAKLKELDAAFQAQKEVCRAMEQSKSELTRAREDLNSRIFEVAGELARLQNEKNALSSASVHKQMEQASLQKDVARLEKDKAQFAVQAQEIEQSLASCRQSEELSLKELESLRAQLAELREKRRIAQEQLSENRMSALRIESQKDALNNKMENDPYHDGTRAVLRNGFPGLKGVAGTLFKYPEHMSRWVETVLGPKSGYLVFDNLHEAQKALEWLKENNLGRATCFVLDKIPFSSLPDLSAIPNANAVIRHVECAPELETLKRYIFGSSFVSSSTLYDIATLDGGSDERLNAESRQTAIIFQLNAQWDEQLAQLKIAGQSLENELSAVEPSVQQTESEIIEKERALEKTRVQNQHWTEVLKGKVAELELLAKDREISASEQSRIESESAEIVKKSEAMDAAVSSLSAQQSGSEIEREALNGRIAQADQELHQAQIVSTQHEVRLQSLTEQWEKTRQAFEEIRAQLELNKQSADETRSEIEKCGQEISLSQTAQQEQSARFAHLQEEKNKGAVSVEAVLNEKAEADTKFRTLESSLQSLRQKQLEISEVLHRAEIESRTVENEMKNIERRLEEGYALPIQDARTQVLERDVQPEEIAKLKRRVESMSLNINLEAPDQHRQHAERYQFLTTQVQDLNKAREDLKSAIQQINAATKEQFRETFNKVRENFKKIYSSLFTGGQADLIFTNQNDMMETGIDMVAQPPGKKLQNIALLSGGEKALTAISLLYAFFMVKPSPFCVLDEVDAPWDPANVGRFLNMLKEFAQKTQFLVVTHNPRTMEVADILYGVTMEEPGVSKILSMRLNREPEKSSATLVKA